MCQLLVFFHVGFEPYQKAFGSENLSEDLRIDSCYFTEEISFIQESVRVCAQDAMADVSLVMDTKYRS